MIAIIVGIIIVIVIIIGITNKSEKTEEYKPNTINTVNKVSNVEEVWNKYGNCSINDLKGEAFFGSGSADAMRKYLLNLFFSSEENGGFGMDKKYIKHFKFGSSKIDDFGAHFRICYRDYGAYDPNGDYRRGSFILEYIKNMTKAGLAEYLFSTCGEPCDAATRYMYTPIEFLMDIHKAEFEDEETSGARFYRELIFNPKSFLYDKRVYNVKSIDERNFRIKLVFAATLKNLIEDYKIYKQDENERDTDELYTLNELLSLNYYDLNDVLSKSKDD